MSNKLITCKYYCLDAITNGYYQIYERFDEGWHMKITFRNNKPVGVEFSDFNFSFKDGKPIVETKLTESVVEIGTVFGDSDDASGREFWTFQPNENFEKGLFNSCPVYSLKEEK